MPSRVCLCSKGYNRHKHVYYNMLIFQYAAVNNYSYTYCF